MTDLSLPDRTAAGSSRIEYIDALRGLTMILVVFNHVATFVWEIIGTGVPSVHEYLSQIRMPMFFFISGFVLYKKETVWNGKHICEFLQRKFMVQIIPTIIFLTLFVHVSHLNLEHALFSYAKEGYWFTYILFQYFLFYALAKFCFRRYADIVMLLAGIAFLPIYHQPITNAIPLPESVKLLLSITYWQYFLFFVIGSSAHKHFQTVEQWLDSRWLLFGCIATYFVLNIYRDVLPGHGHGLIGSFLIGLILTFSGLTVLFAFFRSNKAHFTKEKFLGRSLQYIGRRTLDVYLLHYFFLPRELGEALPVFKEHPMPVIEAACSLAIALLIVACCLLISNIIRLSPILAHYLFGVKSLPSTAGKEENRKKSG